jgi:hypothetical protein
VNRLLCKNKTKQKNPTILILLHQMNVSDSKIQAENNSKEKMIFKKKKKIFRKNNKCTILINCVLYLHPSPLSPDMKYII